MNINSINLFDLEGRSRQISETKQALLSASTSGDLSSIARSVRHLEKVQLSGFTSFLLKIISLCIRLFFGKPRKINRLIEEDLEAKEITNCSKKISKLADSLTHLEHPFVITAGKVDTIATRCQLKAYKAQIFSQKINALKTFIVAPSSDEKRETLYNSTPEKLLKLLRNTIEVYAPRYSKEKMTSQNFDIWLKKLNKLTDTYGMSVLDQLSELYKKKCTVLFEITRLRVLQDKLSSNDKNYTIEELINKVDCDATKILLRHKEQITGEDLRAIIPSAIVSLEENILFKVDALLKDLHNSVHDELAIYEVSAERLSSLIPKEAIAEPINVTMIGAEFTGFVKEGGLAEAIEGMTKGLKANNEHNRVRVILPNYSTLPASIKEQIAHNPLLNFTTSEGLEYTVSMLNQDGIDYYLINHPSFQLTGEKPSVYGPDDETVKKRFLAFTNLAADLAKRTPTDVIHLHDWHVAGVALKLKKENPKNWKSGNIPPIVFTYHNNSRASQGRLSSNGIYNYDPVVQGLIEAGIASETVNLFAETLKVADCVTTVSETFAIESQEIDTGEGMSFAVREAARMGKLTGIINGSNSHSWNPEQDNTLKHWTSTDEKEIDLSYSPNLSPLEITARKNLAKRELQKWIKKEFPENQLDPEKPIVTFIGRFDSNQKGLDKLEEAIVATHAAGGQFIVMGSLEDPKATNLLNSLQEKYKNTVLFIRDYKDANGRLHYQQGNQESPGCGSLIRASSDFLFIPSKFEPCGLVQFEGWLFGAMAIGSDVGGLVDTIITPEKDASAFNGYLFNRDANKNSAANVIRQAIGTFANLSDDEKGTLTKRLIEQGRQYSWTTSPVGLSPIHKYRLVYEQAKKLASRRSQIQKNTVSILERVNQIRSRLVNPYSRQRETNLKEEAYLKYLKTENPKEQTLEKLFLDLPHYLRTQVPSPYGRTCTFNLHKSLGAHKIKGGFRFALDAPNANEVNLVLVSPDGAEKKQPMIKGSNGIWTHKVSGISPKSFYQYEVNGVRKLDPYGNEVANHPVPGNAPCSVADKSNYNWKDAEWMKERVREKPANKPMSITEINPLIWKKKNGGYLNYRELTPLLVEHCKNAGFTHIELMGILEHPDVRSWGYQVSGFFAPTSRMGSPDDFKYLVDHLHKNNIGVILDWVPAHFCQDSFGLAHFDGSNQFQPSNFSSFFAARSWLYSWGTYFFDFRKRSVRNFLYSSATFWIKEMHIDGLRVDAVRSILLSENGNEGRNFFKNLNAIIHREFPGVMTIAEDYSSTIDTTSSPAVGGLGFDFKWHVGWKKHVLDYFSLAPGDRKNAYSTIKKAIDSDNFHKMILAISHDDLQKSIKALIDKTPDLNKKDKYNNLRAFFGFLMGMPGKKLMFAGSEIGSDTTFDTLFDQEKGLFDKPKSEEEEKALLCLQQLNKIYKSERPLWESDDNGHDLIWIENDDPERRIHAFRRNSEEGGSVACIHNFSKEEAKEFFVPLHNKKIEMQLQVEALLIKKKMNALNPHHLTEFEQEQLKLLGGFPHLIKRLKSQKLMDKFYSALFLKKEKLSNFLAQNQIEMPIVLPREIFNSDRKEFGGSGICNEHINKVHDLNGKVLGYKVRVPPLSTLFITELAYSPVASTAPASSAAPALRGN